MQDMQAPEQIADTAEAAGDPGFYHPMTDHLAVFYPRGKQLVVTFDPVAEPEADTPRRPWGFEYFETRGLSHLGLMMTARDDWFRHPEVDACFGELLRHRFFEQFDEVLFLGTSAGAHAAMSFAAAVRGCRIVAFAPQLSPDPAIAPWEDRFADTFQGGAWDAGYSDPQAGAQAARKVQVFYDPFLRQDRLHAEALAAPNVELIRLPGVGHPVPLKLKQASVLARVARAAVVDRVDRVRLRTDLRARRDKPSFVRHLLARAIETGHWRLAEKALAQVTAAHPDWGFRTVNLMLNRARRQEKRARVRARIERREAEERAEATGHVSLAERLRME